MPKITSAIDIGSSKIACMIAQNESNGDIKILGIGIKKSEGIYQGQIQDPQATKKTIQASIHLAEKMAGINIGKNTITNISGLHPHLFPIERQLPLQGRTIRQEDIAALRNEVRYLEDPERQLLHYFEHGFYLDENPELHRNPLSHPCHSLTLKASLLFVDKGRLRQCLELLQMGAVHIGAIAYTPYASAQSTLLPVERQHGTMLLDMGAQTTSLCIYSNDIAVLCDTLPVGGQEITTDIAADLKIPIDNAERLKTLHGNVIETGGDRRNFINVTPHNRKPQTISKSHLIKIIKHRIVELAQNIERLLQTTEISPASIKNIVITGGAANMPGLTEYLEATFYRPVRLAKPLVRYPKTDLQTPQDSNSKVLGLATSTTGSEFACIVGMLRYASSRDFHLGLSKTANDENSLMQLWQWVMQDPI